MYRISFKAIADESRSVTFYAGKASDPWNAYSGYNGITIGTGASNFVFSFTMTNPTDPAARLVFDLGKSTTNISVYDIKVEQLSFEAPVTALQEPQLTQKVTFYPNPVGSILHISELHRYRLVELLDMKGRVVSVFAVTPAISSIPMGNLPRGIYLLKLSGNGFDDRLKVLKE